MTFQKFESLGRLTRDCIFTEKVDGTNAQIMVVHASQIEAEGLTDVPATAVSEDDQFEMYVGSRKKWIAPGKQTDNFGFAGWCLEHAEDLIQTLGEGRHYGEWWGQGIQRGYGLKEKRFSLFNVHRWTDENTPDWLHVVPLLGEAPIEGWRQFADSLAETGSIAAPGFTGTPEGIVAFHAQSGQGFKYTYEGDDANKWQLEAEARK